MLRKCIIIKSSKDYRSRLNRYICVDIENQEEIHQILQEKEKKFKLIAERTLTQNFIYWDCYGPEDINGKTKDITAIKFYDEENTRIYCIEQRSSAGEFYIICSKPLRSKKSQKNDKKIKSLIDSISNYKYEIIK